jgi:hypothetical protein
MLQSTNIDFDRFARDFAARAISDAPGAVASWRDATTGLTSDLRTALGRAVNANLDARGRASLRGTAGGMALSFEWAVDKMLPPAMPQLPFFSPRLGYGYCASLVAERSSATARRALDRGMPLLLGLRKESSTLANQGRGVYDDLIAVLNGRGGQRSARFFPACTEPGAQYSARAATTAKGTRADARYSQVKFKKNEGADVDGDGIPELGRLVEGTYVFTEKTGGFLGNRAFKAMGDQTVERDTNGDGYFDRSDAKRIDTKGAGRSLYIHRGGASNSADVNTWSAGCQTIPGNIYGDFLATIGSPASFCYVLINAR